MPFLLNPCGKCKTRHYSDVDCPKSAKRAKPVTKPATSSPNSVPNASPNKAVEHAGRAAGLPSRAEPGSIPACRSNDLGSAEGIAFTDTLTRNQRWRAKNPEKYRAAQRDLMRKRRAVKDGRLG